MRIESTAMRSSNKSEKLFIECDIIDDLRIVFFHEVNFPASFTATKT